MERTSSNNKEITIQILRILLNILLAYMSPYLPFATFQPKITDTCFYFSCDN